MTFTAENVPPASVSLAGAARLMAEDAARRARTRSQSNLNSFTSPVVKQDAGSSLQTQSERYIILTSFFSGVSDQ